MTLPAMTSIFYFLRSIFSAPDLGPNARPIHTMWMGM